QKCNHRISRYIGRCPQHIQRSISCKNQCYASRVDTNRFQDNNQHQEACSQYYCCSDRCKCCRSHYTDLLCHSKVIPHHLCDEDCSYALIQTSTPTRKELHLSMKLFLAESEGLV